MNKNTENEKAKVLSIIGGLILGIGAGLFFFPTSVFGPPSVFAFTGCILLGFGFGLLKAANLSSKKSA